MKEKEGNEKPYLFSLKLPVFSFSALKNLLPYDM